jgi:hypothetical protein
MIEQLLYTTILIKSTTIHPLGESFYALNAFCTVFSAGQPSVCTSENEDLFEFRTVFYGNSFVILCSK